MTENKEFVAVFDIYCDKDREILTRIVHSDDIESLQLQVEDILKSNFVMFESDDDYDDSIEYYPTDNILRVVIEKNKESV